MAAITVREVLEITANNLGGISVPRSLNEQIGIPIDQAIGNLRACIEAIDRQENMAKETEQNSEGEQGQLSDEQKALLRHAEECFGHKQKEQE